MDSASPRVIRQLPPNLVNQIAAGEVIERPASVVKELMENSIDAGARRVELTIDGGGLERIRIADDGCGMTAEQLPLAVTSHATSKLPDDADLFRVGTLGFRGEALASIGSCSHLTIRTRTADADAGSEMAVRGGAVDPPGPCGCPVGTVTEVRNLFFNTPVRHRFLKTPATERGHIAEAFTRLALGYPAIHFVMRQGEKVMHDLPPTTRWAERIRALIGDEIADHLIPIDGGDDPIAIRGFVGDPAVTRGNTRSQYLFLGGRFIRDRSLQHALGEAYRGMIMVGRFPAAFLHLTMPSELVDVNVHPTKMEVRFTDGGRVYSRLLQTLRHQFLSTDLTHRPRPNADASSGFPPGGSPPLPPPVAPESADGSAHRQSVIDWARTGVDRVVTAGGPTTRTMPAAGASPLTAVPDFQPFGGGTAGRQHVGRRRDVDEPAHEPAPWESSAGSPVQPPDVSPGDPTPSVSYLGFQVHRRYLVTQDGDGMVVIDQHALHERVLYERVCRRVLDEGRPLESQRLLVPETVTLSPAEHAAAVAARDALSKIGLDVEDFGGDTVVIRSHPTMVRHGSPSDMLRSAIEGLVAAGKSPEPKDLLHGLLSTIACKAAVKSGDELTPEEITSLLEQKDLYHDTHHCPHGRPTALFFTLPQLDKMFGRLGAG